MPKCAMCLAGFDLSCLDESCDSTLPEPPTEIPSLTPPSNTNTEELEDGELVEERRSVRKKRKRGRRTQSDSQSSGRKEAAKRYPLDPEKPCEWAGLANAGGGSYPILGCLEGKQQARHHGPDKSVQNNESGNVHRICHYCHYRWHAKNDPEYDWNAGLYPAHEPRPLNETEQKAVVLDYMRYQTSKTKKIKELD